MRVCASWCVFTVLARGRRSSGFAYRCDLGATWTEATSAPAKGGRRGIRSHASRLHDDLALDPLDSRRRLGCAQSCLQRRSGREVAVEMHGVVIHRYSDRAGMEIGGVRNRLVNAKLDVGGRRLAFRFDLEQAVDDTHPVKMRTALSAAS